MTLTQKNMGKLQISIMFLLIVHCYLPLASQNESPILFIYDASGSMWGQLEGRTKKEIAADVLTSAVKSLPENQTISLMAYGHRKKEDCNDVEVIVNLDNDSKSTIIEAVNAITPLGRTPLARSATMAINSLKEAQTKATIILVTDGIESCDGDICQVVTAAKQEGIDFKLHIVGFGIKESETEQLKCAAAAGGGQYYHAENTEGLGEVLNTATATTVDDPAGNFSIFATKNGQAVDAWVRAYKSGTKDEIDYSRTYGDSAFVYLPAGDYDIDIQPLENSDISGTTLAISIGADEIAHRTVSFDAATLNVQTTNNQEGWDTVVKMYHQASGKVAATTRTYGKTKSMEVNPGIYNVNFTALGIKGNAISFTAENVELVAGKTKEITHNFESGIARVGVSASDGELIDATVRISNTESGKSVASGRTYTTENNNPKSFILSPGSYTVKITTLGKHKGTSDSFKLSISAGDTTEKLLKY